VTKFAGVATNHAKKMTTTEKTNAKNSIAFAEGANAMNQFDLAAPQALAAFAFCKRPAEVSPCFG
jgi:hypothetical protein